MVRIGLQADPVARRRGGGRGVVPSSSRSDDARPRAGDGVRPAGRRIAEPKLVLLAVGAVVVIVLCIVAIADTDAVWLVLLTALAIALIGGAIVLDMRRVIAATGDTAELCRRRPAARSSSARCR